MKYLLLYLLLLTNAVFAQEKIIENPPFNVRNSSILEIRKIVTNNKNTEIHFTAYQQPGWWFRIAKDSYIRSNGKKYLVNAAVGLSLDKEIYTDASGKMDFVLGFPPIDANAERIDFIESDCDNCFKIWGIELKSKTATRLIPLPESVRKAPQIAGEGPLPIVGIKLGKAGLKGKILGFVPEMKMKPELFVNNPLTGESVEYELPVAEDGSFKAEIALVSSMQVLLRLNSFFNNYILLAPGKESEVYFDLHQKSRQESKLRIDKCPPSQWVYFGGAYAGINNEYVTQEASRRALTANEESVDISQMSAQDYHNHKLNVWRNKKEKLAQLGCSLQTKQLITLELNHRLISELAMAAYYIESAYRQKNKIGRNDPIPGYKKPVFDSGYYRFLKELDLNNPVNLYAAGYNRTISSCRYLSLDNAGQYYYFSKMPDVMEPLIQMTHMNPEELDYAKYLASQKYENWSPKSIAIARQQMTTYFDSLLKYEALTGTAREEAVQMQQSVSNPNTSFRTLQDSFDLFTFKNMASLKQLKYFILIQNADDIKDSARFSPEFANNFAEKYKPYTDILFEEDRTKKHIELLSAMIDTDKGLLFDLVQLNRMSASLEEMEPVSDAKMERISSLNNPAYQTYLTQRNKEMLAKIAANKAKTGYKVYEAPKVENDALLAEILKPFKDKIVFVDFWNTWCAPCRSAMKTFEPFKQQYKGKDVVFLYLADESSPLTAWQNMITDIPGEHYRLNGEQKNYLAKKFGITGIPSYLIFNRKAEQLYFQTGFPGGDVITGILNKELANK